MPVPSTQEIRKPLLEIFKDEAPHNLVMNELLEIISGKLEAEPGDMNSTEKMAFKNNISEAIKYLLKDKLLSHPTKTTYLITRAGVEFLESSNVDETAEQTPEEEQEDDFPVGLDEPENESVTSEEPQASEVISLEEPQEEISSEDEIDEPIQEIIEEEGQEQTEESDDVFLDNNENEIDDEKIEAEEPQTDETLEDVQDENENDDGIDIEDFDSFDEDQEQENETEIEQEFENETENEDLYEMNKTELETAPETQQELDEEELEELDDAQEQETQAPQNSSFSSEEDLSLEDIFTHYNENLAVSVLERLENLHQDNFCMLVMDLLSKMDYRVFQTARYTNDVEGTDLIQGIILENKPGMNPIYIHARKLSSSKIVSKANMLDFVNALSDKGGKGMFVTTGNFSGSAEEVARDEGIMLVDGKKLASLMIANNFCVNTERIFELKSIDTETFDEYDS